MSQFREVIRLPDFSVHYDTDTRDLTLFLGDSTQDPTRKVFIYKHIGDGCGSEPEYHVGVILDRISEALAKGRAREKVREILDRIHKEQAQ